MAFVAPKKQKQKTYGVVYRVVAQLKKMKKYDDDDLHPCLPGARKISISIVLLLATDVNTRFVMMNGAVAGRAARAASLIFTLLAGGRGLNQEIRKYESGRSS